MAIEMNEESAWGIALADGINGLEARLGSWETLPFSLRSRLRAITIERK